MLNRRNVVLLLALLALIGGLATGRDLWFTIFYVLALLLILSFGWAWANINWVHLTRVTRSRRTQVGRPLEERFTVRNTSFIPKLWLEVRDLSTVPAHHASRVASNLGSQAIETWRVSTICRQRGRYRLGPVSLASSDPFGLFPMKRELPQTTNVVVYPMTVDVHQFALPVGILPGGDALRRRTHYVTTNASGVRDYAPGDSYSRIHWPSTARRNRLIVKEFELDPLGDIWIVADMASFNHIAPQQDDKETTHLPPWMELFDPSSPLRTGFKLPETTEEYTVTIAASLAQYFLRRNRAVGMLAYGQSHEVVQPDRGERQLNRILETLAVLRAKGQMPLEDAVRAELKLLPRGTTLIVVTPTTSEKWATAARLLVRRGLRVVTVLVDPHSFGSTRTAAGLVPVLQASGVGTYLIKSGDDLTSTLSRSSTSTGYYTVA